MTDENGRRCSFCRKHEDHVHLLIARANAYICDFCIIACAEVAARFFETKSKSIREQVDAIHNAIRQSPGTVQRLEHEE